MTNIDVIFTIVHIRFDLTNTLHEVKVYTNKHIPYAVDIVARVSDNLRSGMYGSMGLRFNYYDQTNL